MIVVRTKFTCRAFGELQFDRPLWSADMDLTARTTCSVCWRWAGVYYNAVEALFATADARAGFAECVDCLIAVLARRDLSDT